MSANDNPNFRFVDRAPYEIHRLFRQLPADFSQFAPVSPEHRLIAEATHRHAANASETIACGLEALGHVLTIAALNQESNVEARHMVRIGELVSHLAVQLQVLNEVEFTITDALTADEKRRAGTKS